MIRGIIYKYNQPETTEVIKEETRRTALHKSARRAAAQQKQEKSQRIEAKISASDTDSMYVAQLTTSPTHTAIVTDSVEAAKDTMPSRKRNDYSPIEDYHPTAQKKHDKSSWQASVSYSGGADANSSVFTERPGSAISGTEKETVEEKTRHYMPFIVSLPLQKSLGSRLGIGTGLRYTRLRTDITTVNSWNSNTRTQTVEYIGVPLNATYRLWNSGNFSLYTTAGVAADIPVSGSKTWQWSVSAGVGAQYSLTPRISVNTVFKRHASHG